MTDASGIDTITSTITRSLEVWPIENLTLLGAAAINGTGNGARQRDHRNDAANMLDGGAGTDTLNGGAGNDTYVLGDGNDTVSDSGGSTPSPRPSPARWLVRDDREPDAARTAAINGTGNALANTITGNAAANILDGGAGADTLIGGAGNDTYVLGDDDRHRHRSGRHRHDHLDASARSLAIFGRRSRT